jgi:hypothetical protein
MRDNVLSGRAGRILRGGSSMLIEAETKNRIQCRINFFAMRMMIESDLVPILAQLKLSSSCLEE